MVNDICRQLRDGLSRSVICSDVGGFVQVRTPYFYPDGTVIDLFVRQQGDSLTVTDLGETFRWLDTHSLTEYRTAKQQQLIERVRGVLDVEIFKGMIQARASPETLADAFVRVSQAALRISDVSFTFRTHSPGSVTDDVEEFLKDRKIPHERNALLVGLSGKQWRVDFHTRLAQHSALVQVLSTGSRAAVSRITDHAVSEWVDLRAWGKDTPGDSVTLISLFDDTLDVWKPEDYRQLEGVSEVVFWSQPESFAQILAS